MNRLSKTWITLLMAGILNLQSVFSQETRKIQCALLLDTSNSMDGLIDQAKSQLWGIVKELSAARFDGKMPQIEIALYEYGNDGLAASEGYIRLVVPFTRDLDKVSEHLFALRTNGGNEYCGMVIDKSLSQLKWSSSDRDMKMIYIAGNEPFTQGNVSYEKVCKSACAKGINVNTIYCGDYQQGIRENWKSGAEVGCGVYANIDHNRRVVQIETPYDLEIKILNNKINSTYIEYGAEGKLKKENQAAQDKNAGTVSGAALAERAAVKSSEAYNNESWDLVDALTNGKKDITKISVQDLPAEIQKLSPEQRMKYIEAKAKEREKLKAEIAELSKKRTQYINSQKPEAAEPSLGKTIVSGIKTKAQEKGYSFEK
jgi:hypothetical protein